MNEQGSLRSPGRMNVAAMRPKTLRRRGDKLLFRDDKARGEENEGNAYDQSTFAKLRQSYGQG